MKQRVVPMILVVATIVALVLNSQGKLIGPDSVTQVLFTPDGYKFGDLRSFGTFGMAFFAYLLVVSILSDKEAEWVTAILVIGALFWNEHEHAADGNGVLSIFFSPSSASAATPGQINIPFPTGKATEPVTIPHPFGGGN